MLQWFSEGTPEACFSDILFNLMLKYIGQIFLWSDKRHQRNTARHCLFVLPQAQGEHCADADVLVLIYGNWILNLTQQLKSAIQRIVAL